MSDSNENPYLSSAESFAEEPQADPPAPAPQPSRPRVWPALLAMPAGLVVAIFMQIVVVVIIAAGLGVSGVDPAEFNAVIQSKLTSPAVMLAFIVVGPGAFGLVAWAAAMASKEPILRRLGFFRVENPAAVYPLTMLGSIVPLTVSLVVAEFLARYTFTDKSFLKFFEEVTVPIAVPFVILIGVVPGLCEEMLFRGFIQRRLIQRWGAAAGIGVASVLFGLAHIFPPNVALATIIGVWLGVIAWRTGSIGPAIACHLFINAGLNAWRMVIKFAGIPDETATVVNWVFLAIGVVAFLLACRMLANHPRPTDPPTETTTPLGEATG